MVGARNDAYSRAFIRRMTEIEYVSIISLGLIQGSVKQGLMM